MDLVAYLSTFVGKYAPSTIRKRYDALAYWSLVHIQPFDVDKRIIKKVYTAAGNAYAKITKTRLGLKLKNFAVAVEAFKEKVQEKPEEKGFFTAVKAIGSTGLFGMPRFGELTSPRNGQNLKEGEKMSDFFAPKIHVNGGNLELLTKGDILMFKIHLPFTKTAGVKGEDIFVAEQKAVDFDVCPVEAIKEQVQENLIDETLPLFSYLDRNGLRKFMTTNGALSAYNAVFKEKGLPEIKGHDFRTGGQNLFTVASVHPDSIRQVGRWKSNAIE
jgi:hypothetical protein